MIVETVKLAAFILCILEKYDAIRNPVGRFSFLKNSAFFPRKTPCGDMKTRDVRTKNIPRGSFRMGLRSAKIQPSVNTQSQSNPKTKARRFLGKKTPRFCLELKNRRKRHASGTRTRLRSYPRPTAPRDKRIAPMSPFCPPRKNCAAVNKE